MELARLVEAGPDRAVHGVVRWRRVDLRDELKRRFGVELHERSVGRILAVARLSPSFGSSAPSRGRRGRPRGFSKRMARPVCNRVFEISS